MGTDTLMNKFGLSQTNGFVLMQCIYAHCSKPAIIVMLIFIEVSCAVYKWT